jgi:integral membrane protein
VSASPQTAIPQELRGAMLWYRVMSWVTGVALLGLCLGMVLKYGFDVHNPVVDSLAQLHGFLYIVYLLSVGNLGLIKMRWPIPRLLLTALAGTVPVMSFIFERKITHEIEREAAAGEI